MEDDFDEIEMEITIKIYTEKTLEIRTDELNSFEQST